MGIVRIALLLAAFAVSLAPAWDLRRFGSLPGRLDFLTQFLKQHPDTLARHPSLSTNFFGPLQMAANLALQMPPTPERQLLTIRVSFAEGGTPLILEEVPPHVALYRGYVVPDPPSRRFPLYGLVPGTRTFWIRDDLPGAQPKAFAFAVTATKREDGASIPMLLEVIGKLSEKELRGAAALLDSALGSGKFLVPSPGNPLSKFPENRVAEMFSFQESRRVPISFPQHWPLAEGLDRGQRRPTLEVASSSPFHGGPQRAAFLGAPASYEGLTINKANPAFHYEAPGNVLELPPWERVLLASAVFEERRLPATNIGSRIFGVRLGKTPRAIARSIARMHARDDARAKENESTGVATALAEIEATFRVTYSDIEHAHQLRERMRVLFRDDDINGYFGPREFALASALGFQKHHLFLLPPRVAATSFYSLVRGNILTYQEVAPHLRRLWLHFETQLLVSDVSVSQRENELQAMAHLVPLLPNLFDDWYAAVSAFQNTKPSSWHNAMVWAATTGDTALVDRVYALRGERSRSDIFHAVGAAFGDAAGAGSLEMLAHLRTLATSGAGYEERGVQYAAIHGRPDVLRFLLTGDLYRHTWPEVEFRQTIDWGHAEALEVLLDLRPPSQEQLDDLLLRAAGADSTAPLRLLLSRYQFSEDLRKKAFAIAAREEGERHAEILLGCGARLAN